MDSLQLSGPVPLGMYLLLDKGAEIRYTGTVEI